MCTILDREVWDCLVPAAIREDIVIPQLRRDIASFDSDDSELSINRGKTPYQKAFRKRMERKTKELGLQTEEEGALGFLSALLLEPEQETEGINPPAIYFDMHKLPKAPTWSDKEVDDEWLPRSPSLVFDDYSITGRYKSQKSWLLWLMNTNSIICSL